MPDGNAARQVDRRVKERIKNEKRKDKFFHHILSLRFHYRGRIVLVFREILA